MRDSGGGNRIYIRMVESNKEKVGRLLGNPSNNKAFIWSSCRTIARDRIVVCKFHPLRDLPMCDHPPGLRSALHIHAPRKPTRVHHPIS